MVNVKVWMASPFHYIPLFFFWVAKLCLYKVLDCISQYFRKNAMFTIILEQISSDRSYWLLQVGK